jgi:predicted nucleic acid-binding protein
MLYFDTSFLVPLFFAESTSSRVAAFIGGQRRERLAVSHWTKLEFSSVLAREVRAGKLEGEVAAAVNVRFDDLVASSFAVLLPSAADFELSRAYLQRHDAKLRVGDAFHLAIAKNHSARAVYSFVGGLARAASLLGIRANPGF